MQSIFVFRYGGHSRRTTAWKPLPPTVQPAEDICVKASKTVAFEAFCTLYRRLESSSGQTLGELFRSAQQVRQEGDGPGNIGNNKQHDQEHAQHRQKVFHLLFQAHLGNGA